MFQGTGSDVGKSIIVAGLCRLASNRGIRVAPFKPQNMSNNAAVCDDGGEIGRAQALQALACRLPNSVHFNPVLLKPQTDRSAQVIVQGQPVEVQSAAGYMRTKRRSLLPSVLQSHAILAAQYDLILVEGAGSASEVNLRQGDIANMGFALATNTPVCLIADIERGGVIASLAGTHAVLPEEDRALVQSFIINKFRGDPALFDDGLQYIRDFTGWRSCGVIPWLPLVGQLPEEDAANLEQSRGAVAVESVVESIAGSIAGTFAGSAAEAIAGTMAESGAGSFNESAENRRGIKIAAPLLPRIANFDDLDPLKMEPGVDVVFVPPGQPIPLDVDAVILLGTKSAIGDLQFLIAQGWHHDITAIARAGGHVLGICGGYQMLGNMIHDGQGFDGASGAAQGLGLLDVDTTMQPEKTVMHSHGQHVASGLSVSGYEIHVGATEGPGAAHPFAQLRSGADGAVASGGNVCGTYLHGLFTEDAFRHYWLGQMRPGTESHRHQLQNYEAKVDSLLDELAAELERHLDVDALFADAR
ncbi:MAG: adenosylcobyric acid synthase [Candidatus Azotimanducaceae bacterium]|jgi:adenosylcobyric acid synthase